MKTAIEERWGTHPEDVKHYVTTQLRKEFLIETPFVDNEVWMIYSHNDRMVIGGVQPVRDKVKL